MNDNNILTLREWILKHNVNKEEEQKNYMRLFYNMDFNMKQLHNQGYYIESFNVDNILINNTQVKFNVVRKLYSEDKEYLIHKNIYYMSCLALGTYNSCLDYINPENKSVLKEVYPDFSSFIPDEVKPYYKGIFERDAGVYLCDYVNARRQKDINDLDSTINVNSRSYNKSTLAGRLYDSDNNIAAFAAVYVFPAIIFLMAIVIPLLIIISK